MKAVEAGRSTPCGTKMPITISEHISVAHMEKFCAHASDDVELITVAEHLAACEDCHRLFHEVFTRRKGSAPFALTLTPETVLRHEHLSYEQLVSYAEHRSERDERELIDMHLGACGRCREDIADFLSFRERIEPELAVSYAPVGRTAWRDRVSAWWGRSLPLGKPAYAALAAVLLVGVVTATLLIYTTQQSRVSDRQARQSSPVSQHNASSTTHADELSIPTPPIITNNTDTPANSEPRSSGQTNSARITTKKSLGAITVASTERSRQSDERSRAAEEELLAQNIERPHVLSQIASESGVLRGEEVGENSFELLTPARAVIAMDRPTFSWRSLPGAANYRVQVADSRNREVANSGELSSSSTAWTPLKPLERGEVYTWVVIATVGDEEVISPAPTAAEMRFKVLSAGKKRELDSLQRSTNSHLTRGIFYAREGMIVEAESEFRAHINLSPRSPLARKLLRTVQSWR